MDQFPDSPAISVFFVHLLCHLQTHTPAGLSPSSPAESSGTWGQQEPHPPPDLIKPVTCGKAEQENKVDKHEATQVSQDHLQERVGLSEPSPGLGEAEERARAASVWGWRVNLELKGNQRTYRRGFGLVVFISGVMRELPQLPPHPPPLAFVLVGEGSPLYRRWVKFQGSPQTWV